MPDKYRYGLITGIVGGFLFILPVLPFPFDLAGLSFGVTASIVSSLSGAAVISILAQNLAGGLVFLIMYGAPIIFLTQLTLRSRTILDGQGDQQVEWYPIGSILAWVAVWATCLFLLAYLASMNQDGGLQKLSHEFVVSYIEEHPFFGKELITENAELSSDAMVIFLGNAMPAFCSIFMMFIMFFNFLCAQFFSEKIKRAIRPPFNLTHMELPELLALGFIASVGLALLGGEFVFVGGTIAAILFSPFFLMGLFVIHTVTKNRPGRMLVLMGVYVGLFFFSPLIIVIGSLGLAEQWLQIRRRTLNNAV